MALPMAPVSLESSSCSLPPTLLPSGKMNDCGSSSSDMYLIWIIVHAGVNSYQW